MGGKVFFWFCEISSRRKVCPNEFLRKHVGIVLWQFRSVHSFRPSGEKEWRTSADLNACVFQSQLFRLVSLLPSKRPEAPINLKFLFILIELKSIIVEVNPTQP